jgi:hypothetical protein
VLRKRAGICHDNEDHRPSGRPRVKSLFKQRARGRNGSTMLSVFEAKKEIPV